MDNKTLADKLLSIGFVEGERDPKNPTNYADIGASVNGLWYGYRVHQGQWQYVALCSYLGVFVEAVVTIYPNKFNSRLKPQQKELFAGLSRDDYDLLTLLDKVYELPKVKD